jgi:hypothetical protein
MDVIPSSLKSFYIEYGSSKFLIAIYGPLRRKKNKKLKCCQFETVLLEIFEKPSSFNNLEKSSFFINSIIERLVLNKLLSNSKFFILIRKIKEDGKIINFLTWASHILISLSDLPQKNKIKFNDLGLIKEKILLDLTSEELFFTKTNFEIVFEEENEHDNLAILGDKFENFMDFEKIIKFAKNSFLNLIFSRTIFSKYNFSFL